jgi:hypothetical protein
MMIRALRGTQRSALSANGSEPANYRRARSSEADAPGTRPARYLTPPTLIYPILPGRCLDNVAARESQ